MKNSIKFITESQDNVKLLDELESSVRLYETKSQDEKEKENLGINI